MQSGHPIRNLLVYSTKAAVGVALLVQSSKDISYLTCSSPTWEFYSAVGYRTQGIFKREWETSRKQKLNFVTKPKLQEILYLISVCLQLKVHRIPHTYFSRSSVWC